VGPSFTLARFSFLALLALSARAEETEIPPHYLNKGTSAALRAPASVSVPAPLFRFGFTLEPSDEEAVAREEARVVIERLRLEKEREWAKSVFVARGGKGGGTATAFLVGADLVHQCRTTQ
jgi:hypothetical protein